MIHLFEDIELVQEEWLDFGVFLPIDHFYGTDNSTSFGAGFVDLCKWALPQKI